MAVPISSPCHPFQPPLTSHHHSQLSHHTIILSPQHTSILTPQHTIILTPQHTSILNSHFTTSSLAPHFLFPCPVASTLPTPSSLLPPPSHCPDHPTLQLYGGAVANQLLSALGRLFTAFLQLHGFSLGVEDILVTSKVGAQ